MKFLFSIEKIRSLDNKTLKEYCINLERSLEYNKNLEIDELNIFIKLKKEVNAINVINYVKELILFEISILFIE